MPFPIAPKQRTRGDKIFDNNYNSGTIDYEQYAPAQILNSFEAEQLSPYYDAQEYYRKETLIELLNTIWQSTEWSKTFGNTKKIPKQYLSEIFTILLTSIEDKTYSYCEMTVGIADFLDVSYKMLYEMISPIYKTEILKEVDNQFGVLDKNTTTSLF